jgi:uncharacterized protein
MIAHATTILHSPRASRQRGAAWRVIGQMWLALLLALVAAFATAAEGDFIAVPKLEKRVTDTTGTLSGIDEARIEARLKAFEAAKGAQIAVLIVDSTIPETVFDYSTRVFTEWKLGRKGVDDGVLLVVAKGDRKLQILTGPGISGSLTDAMSKRIISEIIAPKFRAGDFAGGIDSGVARIISVIEGEALPPPPKKRVATSGGSFENFVVLAILAAVFVGPFLRAILGRFLGAAATGGVTGAAAWFIAGGLALPIVAGVLVFFAVLFMGVFRGFTGGGGGGWTSGGGSWGGGDSGGGGFSGGGGSFDGGGASGDW